MERHVNPEDPDLYALGALEGEEKQAFEAHVRACPACARELELARERVALLGLMAPAATPSPAVKDAVMRWAGGEARKVRQAAPRGWLGWLTPALAAACLVFALLAGGLWARNARYIREIRQLQGQLAVAQTRSLQIARASGETEKLLGMPGTVPVALKPMHGMSEGRVGVLYNAKMGMVSCAGWLPAAPPSKSYQLWLVPMHGDPVSLRVFSGEWNEPMTMAIKPGMDAKAFAVTEEPEGGMPHPTGPMVLMGAAG